MTVQGNDNDERQRDIKKSRFISSTTADDTATFDFVYNGQNLKITKADLVALFGTTGSLEQLGEVTGVPVLSKSGTTNRIRNIIGNSGVVASTSPENGVQLDHNFTQDATGVPVLSDPAAESPIIRSLTGGAGINVAAQNGNIQIALSETPTTSKTIIVNTIDDYPTPVAGTITLEGNTQYFQANDISTSNRFVLGDDTVLSGSDGTLITLEYTGVGIMFTSINNSNKIKEIIVSCPNGTLLDISCPSCTNLFQIVNSRILSCDEVGTVDNMFAANFQNLLWGEIKTDGMKFVGNISIISFFQNIGSISAGTFVDLQTSTFDGFSFSNSQGALASGATFISGLADSGNVNEGGLATVTNTRSGGLGTPLSGITPNDALWEFLSNSGIPNSRTTILATNAGVTVDIISTDTPVIIGATWVFQEGSRFEATAGGRFTYTGTGAFVSLHATVTADIVAGTKIPCTFYWFKNGVEITDSGVRRDFTFGSAGNFSLLWGDELETDDYIEVFAENNGSTTDIIIENAIVRID